MKLDMTKMIQRIGYLEGAIEGIKLYAIWRNGEQQVGCLERPLKEVLKPYKEELTRLISVRTEDRCEWREDVDGDYETSCDNLFILIDGTPTDNGMSFCPYCGRVLITTS